MLVSIFLRFATVRLAGVATNAESNRIYSYRSNNNLHKFARPATRSNSLRFFSSFVFIFLPAGTEIPKSNRFFPYFHTGNNSRQWRAVFLFFFFLVAVFPLSSAHRTEVPSSASTVFGPSRPKALETVLDTRHFEREPGSIGDDMPVRVDRNWALVSIAPNFHFDIDYRF